MMGIERIAIGLMMALLGWVGMTVQALTIDVAVIKSQTTNGVSVVDFSQLRQQTTTQIENHQRWLSRLSDRINKLEKEKK